MALSRACARATARAAAELAGLQLNLQLARGLTATRLFAAAAGDEQQRTHAFDGGGNIVGSYTPVTKQLWQQRYKWSEENLRAATPRDPAGRLVKHPKLSSVVYPFSSDEVLKEHVRAGLCHLCHALLCGHTAMFQL
jgi:acyl-coenzyme A thioesterase 9